jgi:hypothetical protein
LLAPPGACWLDTGDLRALKVGLASPQALETPVVDPSSSRIVLLASIFRARFLEQNQLYDCNYMVFNP